jgi:hypothetical protein
MVFILIIHITHVMNKNMLALIIIVSIALNTLVPGNWLVMTTAECVCVNNVYATWCKSEAVQFPQLKRWIYVAGRKFM